MGKVSQGGLHMAKPRAYRIALEPEEKSRLEDIVRDATSSKTVITRCRILLAADESQSEVCLARTEISEMAGASLSTVTTTLKAYLQIGLDGVLSLKRSEKSDTSRLKATEPVKQLIFEITNAPPPTGCRCWSARLISKELMNSYGVGLSRSSVSRILKAPLK